MRKRLLSMLVLLAAVATGSWAQDQYPIVYDFDAAANANENPANKNGSSANGQAFYAWANTLKAACCPRCATYGAAATASTAT